MEVVAWEANVFGRSTKGVDAAMRAFALDEFGKPGSGTVDAVGEGVEEFSVGDRVFGGVGKKHFGEGTLAEFATASASTIARSAPGLDAVTGAALPLAGVSALQAVDAIEAKAGERIVVIGTTWSPSGPTRSSTMTPATRSRRFASHTRAACRRSSPRQGTRRW